MLKASSIFVLFFILFFTQESVQAADLNCSSFWQFYGNPLACVEYKDNGEELQIAGKKYRFFHYAENWDSDENKLKILQWAKQSLIASFDVYKKFGAMPSIYFILTKDTHPDDGKDFQAYAEASPTITQNGEPCPVVLYKTTFTAKEEEIKQIIAHEIFHCFQGENFKFQLRGNKGPSKDWTKITAWWAEGTAHYFSNLVYPSTNMEQKPVYLYKAGVQPHLQENAYSLDAFFQSLGNSEWFGPSKIIDLLKALPFEGPMNMQRKPMSKNKSLNWPFSHFARQLTNQKIADTGGGYLPTQYLPSEFNSTTAEKENKTYPIKVTPFTANIVEFSLPPGGEFSFQPFMPLFMERGVIAAIRKKGNSEWLELNPLEQRFNTSCNENGVVVELLITSTEDSDDKVETPVTINYEKMDCPCKKTSDPLPACYQGQFVLDNSIIFEVFSGLGQGSTYVGAEGELRFTLKKDKSMDMTFNQWAQRFLTIMPMSTDVLKIKNTFNGTLTGELGVTPEGEICFLPTQDNSKVTTVVTFPKGEEVSNTVDNQFTSYEASSTGLKTECTAEGISFDTTLGGQLETPLHGLLKRQ